MANLDKEIADALAKVKRLREKKRIVEEKERARFAEAVFGAIDEIENRDAVSVAALIDLAHAKINEQKMKRSRAAEKAAAKRRAAAQIVSDFEQHSEPFINTENHDLTGL